MKVLSIPSSGKIGNAVAFRSKFGQCQRAYTIPNPRSTPARRFMRGLFGNLSQGWGPKLRQEQRDRWSLAGSRVMSHPRLSQRGPLSGQQLWQSINSVRGRVGLPPTLEPPAPVVFDPIPIGRLILTNGEDGVKLLLAVSGEVTTDIMVFGQEPCSAGRSKRRNVAYLGLLPAAAGGMSDITDIYKARYGEPQAGTKVFIVTRQQKDGWQGLAQESSEIVPDRPAGQQAAATATLTLQVHMHKGCTREAQGTNAAPAPGYPQAGKADASPVNDRYKTGASQEQAVPKTLSRLLRLILLPNGPCGVALPE
jgi:hypothetical protein